MKNSTRFGTVALTGALLLSLGLHPLDTKSVGRINFILGDQSDIKIRRLEKPTWQYARLFSPVFDGDRFITESESRCEIQLAARGAIRIGENADFTLKHDPVTKQGSSILQTGRLWASVRGLFSKQRFQIRTPSAVCSVRGTIYRIDADSSTKVMVYDGEVDVGPASFADDETSAPRRQPVQIQQPHEIPGPQEVPGPFEVTLEQWVRIVAGYQIEVRADGKYHQTKIDQQADEQDEWVRWNKQRDQSQ
ncbi:MAG TPA: hypothetical protein ENN22_07560 [bacterium]|nr:hypothetical protein [bacterium]